MCRALVDSILQGAFADISIQDIGGQTVYLLPVEKQLRRRVEATFVPAVSCPSPADLETVGDFLASPACARGFEANPNFPGELLFLSAWADGGNPYRSKNQGKQTSIWAVLVHCTFFTYHPDLLYVIGFLSLPFLGTDHEQHPNCPIQTTQPHLGCVVRGPPQGFQFWNPWQLVHL